MYKLTTLSLMASIFLFFQHPVYASTQAETEKMLSDTSKKLATLEAKYEALANVVHILVKYGNNSGGLSPLCYAARKGDMEAVTTLLENGADIDAQSWQTRSHGDGSITTALSEAIKLNNIEMVKALIELGATYDYDNQFDSSEPHPLRVAVNCGSLEAFNILMQNKEHFNYALSNSSLLNHAIGMYRYDLVVALVEAGADVVNVASTNENDYPLQSAAYLSYRDNPVSLDIVRFLVEHGATRKNVHYSLNCKVIKAYLESVGK